MHLTLNARLPKLKNQTAGQKTMEGVYKTSNASRKYCAIYMQDGRTLV